MTRPGEDVEADGGHGLNHTLLASLGLPPDASLDEVRARRDELDAYLTSAPEGLAPWAQQQAAAAKAAYAVLAGEAPAVTEPARRSRLVPLLVALLGVGVIVGVYFMGGTPQGAASAPASTPTASAALLDEARASELAAQVAANPADHDALRELGRMYYSVGDYPQAAVWQQKLVDALPEDTDARLALGVALFNDGDLDGAEKHWTRAAELDPTQAEVFYNLGFLYLSMDPPDLNKVRTAWNRVVQIAPDSALAQTAASHLQRLESPAPAASAQETTP